MIILIENGRLGNQLFQLNYVFKIRKNNEFIILIGFNSIKKILKKNFFIIFVPNFFFLNNFVIKYRYYIIKLIKILKLNTIIYEQKNERIITKYGFISNFRLVTGFFQNHQFISSKFIQWICRDTVFEKIAKKKILDIKKKYNKIIFIHYRATDFINWPNKNYPAILPRKWIKKCLKMIYKNNKKILIFTDDISYFKKKIRLKQEVLHYNELVDFFIMVNSDEGIISPSTYGWWASYLMKLDNKNSKILAPKFWAGHKLKKNFPRYINTPKFKYINVSKSDYKN